MAAANGLIRLLLATLLAFALAGPGHAADERFRYPKQFSLSAKGVNMQTGRFTHSANDLSIGDLALTRLWGDQTAFHVGGLRTFGLGGSFNRVYSGWNHSLNQGTVPRYDSTEQRVTVYVDGGQYEFALLSGGTPAPMGRPASGTYLRFSGSNLLFTDKAGTLYSFFVHPAFDQMGSTNLVQVLGQTTKPDGTVLTYSYRANGQLQEVRSSRGYALHLDYDANNNVAKVCGYNLAQTYVAPATACQSGAIAASYAYDAGGVNLTSATGPTGDVVGHQYHALSATAFAPSCITLANRATCAITNVYAGPNPPAACITAQPDQIASQVSATGNVWSYCFDPPADPNDVPYTPGFPRYSQASVSDPATGNHILYYDRGRLVDHDSAADGIVNYKYPNTVVTVPTTTKPITFEFSDTVPEMITQPRGDRLYFIPDARGNILIQSRWPLGSPDPVLENGSAALSSDPDLRRCCITPGVLLLPAGASTIRQAFLPSFVLTGPYVVGCGSGDADARLCDKPVWRIDERGNQTDFAYDPAHGGVLKETGPAVDGVRPETRYTYVQRHAWLRTSGGGYAQAATPVWLPASRSLCKAGAANPSGAGCATAGDEVVTTYDYGPDSGPNNLLLRGQVEDAGGLSLRTCYRYDAQGNRISETKPRAGLGSCP